jgi:hypothetical protein
MAQIAETAAPAERQVDQGREGCVKYATDAAQRCKTGARLIMMGSLASLVELDLVSEDLRFLLEVATSAFELGALRFGDGLAGLDAGLF